MEPDHARSPLWHRPFLFTDIAGSTALWERDRAAPAAVMAEHIALLDEPTSSVSLGRVG